MNGDEELGLTQSVNDLQLFLAGVAGNVQAFALFVDHLRTLAVQLVDNTGNRLFVAGNGRGGNDDPVAGLDIHLLVGGKRHPVKGGHTLTLRAGGYDHDLVLGQALNGGKLHQSAGRDLQVAQFLCHPQHIFHTPAGDGNLSAIPLCRCQNSLNPVHIRGKGGDDNAIVAILELPVKALGHPCFAGGVAGTLHIGGVAQQRQNALVAQFTEPGQVDHTACGGGVDLEVTGHYNRANRGLDGKSHRVGDRVIHADELHGKTAGLYHIAGLVGDKLDLVGQLVLVQFQFNKTVCHSGAVNGTLHLLHAVGDRTDVILVTVGNEHTPQLLCVLDKVGKVGDHQIHTVHILVGKAHTAVDHDHISAVFKNGDVLADLIQSAKGDDF